MSARPPVFHAGTLAGEGDTLRLARDCARAARKGDIILLEGGLGAGKTTFARAFLRTLAGDPELEVPSPTYTLAQPYPGALPALHADLYRLGDASEADALALDEAAGEGVVLVEWPERAPELHARAALVVSLDGTGAARGVTLAAPPSEAPRFARSLAIGAFLAAHGLADARRAPFTGDASARSYEIVTPAAGAPVILMNAPRMPDGPPIRDGLPYSRLAHLAESVTPFVAIARLLEAHGFTAPRILAQDLDAGLLLVSDLGRDGLLDAEGRPIPERYCAAAEILADLHAVAWPDTAEAAPGVRHAIPAYSRRAMLVETELFTDWYWPARLGRPPSDAEREGWTAAWNAILDGIAGSERTLVLRDHHSPNVLWRGDRAGRDRIGLIDFQDAVIGPAAYDVASLARDARVDIDPGLEARVVEAYAARRRAAGGFDEAGFRSAFAVMAAQRNAKILGIFIRLDRRDGKPAYLRHLPRVEAYFGRSLCDPAMAPAARLLAAAGFAFPGWAG